MAAKYPVLGAASSKKCDPATSFEPLTQKGECHLFAPHRATYVIFAQNRKEPSRRAPMPDQHRAQLISFNRPFAVRTAETTRAFPASGFPLSEIRDAVPA